MSGKKAMALWIDGELLRRVRELAHRLSLATGKEVKYTNLIREAIHNQVEKHERALASDAK